MACPSIATRFDGPLKWLARHARRPVGLGVLTSLLLGGLVLAVSSWPAWAAPAQSDATVASPSDTADSPAPETAVEPPTRHDDQHALLLLAMKDTRQEHYDRALASWRKIYQQTDGNPAVWEATWALEALASLAYARTVTTPTLSPGQVQAMADDAATFDQFLQAMAKRGQKPAETVLTSRLKLSMAQAHPMDAAFLAQLKNLAYASDDMAAGEALFLLGQPAEANHHFEALDGQNAEGFLGLGDRLLLLGALDMAGAMYHRGLELAPTQDDPMDTVGQLKEGLARIEAKRQLAASWIKTGDGLFQAKKYNQALSQYQRASQLYPEWLTPYLRQGDTYERLKQKAAAAKAFGQAVHLNPDLLQSTAFAKRYRRLQKV